VGTGRGTSWRSQVSGEEVGVAVGPGDLFIARSLLIRLYAIPVLFSGTECVLEKWRGKHDGYNPVISGCAVGAALSAKQGPQVCVYGTWLYGY
jgi:hypothetical protein